MFWSDWARKQVKRGNKFHGGDAALIHAAGFRPMDLHVVHPVQQPQGRALRHAMSECYRSSVTVFLAVHKISVGNLRIAVY